MGAYISIPFSKCVQGALVSLVLDFTQMVLAVP